MLARVINALGWVLFGLGLFMAGNSGIIAPALISYTGALLIWAAHRMEARYGQTDTENEGR